LTAEVPLHLEDHLEEATIVGSEVPADLPEPVVWNFDHPQPDWKPLITMNPNVKPVKVERTDDALRVTLDESNRAGKWGLFGGIVIDLPEWSGRDWGAMLVRARSSDGIRRFSVGVNTKLGEPSTTRLPSPYEFRSKYAHVVNDGTVQTYRLRLGPSPPKGTWRRLGLWIRAKERATFEPLSVTIIPTEAAYAHAPVGVRTEIQSEALRRTLYTHTPGRLEYRVRVPEAGRLDLGLGVLREDVPVTFRITAGPEGGEAETLLEETYADQARWAQRSVDLSHLGGRTITLALEADAGRAGTVALWAAPTLTGARATEKPNIIFYVIDGGAADHMSVYGYNRRTTPNLERLAAEGAVFEHAYSNATWTQPSTSSFMTSLHTSVLGGYKGWGDPMIPEQEVTMAHHLHRAGYQTAVFTDNSYAGTEAALERDGVDVLRDTGVGVPPYVELHEGYWRWREAYPGEPYWVHFQPELHWPFKPVSPFAGLYVSPELRERHSEWERQLEAALGRRLAWLADSAALTKAGIDPVAHFHARRGLYDEAMADQDYQLGQLVERLKEAGEWEHTLLIVAADHGSWHAGHRDPSGTDSDPMFRSSVTRIPLLVFWPGRIAGGQRLSQPVSMIDVLPTILDLVGLPMPEVMQGQSLAPLLLGEEGWEPRPVILDEFDVDPETSEFRGVIEVVDGRWGASLEINPHPDKEPIQGHQRQRTVPLLLYDLWNDPYCLKSLHEERPDLVEKYTDFLEAQFEAHQTLAKHFTRSAESPLNPEQLRTLRSLGYIQ
jgi:arylsulfatase A-like enzyme